MKMKLDTKVTSMGSITPKLCLFVILSILGSGHIENSLKKYLPYFFFFFDPDSPVTRSPEINDCEGLKTIPIFQIQPYFYAPKEDHMASLGQNELTYPDLNGQTTFHKMVSNILRDVTNAKC